MNWSAYMSGIWIILLIIFIQYLLFSLFSESRHCNTWFPYSLEIKTIEKYQQQQKQMEELNKQKKALLLQAIEQRYWDVLSCFVIVSTRIIFVCTLEILHNSNQKNAAKNFFIFYIPARWMPPYYPSGNHIHLPLFPDIIDLCTRKVIF